MPCWDWNGRNLVLLAVTNTRFKVLTFGRFSAWVGFSVGGGCRLGQGSRLRGIVGAVGRRVDDVSDGGFLKMSM